MNALSSTTEAVVRNHLQAFVEQKGVAAILDDYDENARLVCENRICRGKEEIRAFFADFLGSLSGDAVSGFRLTSLTVDGNLAQITWHAGRSILLGTDTFVIERGKIVSQTFAMYSPPAR